MPSVAAAGQAEAGDEEGEKEGKESVTGRDRVAVYNSLSLATCTTHTFFSGFANCIYIRQVSNGTAYNWKKEVFCSFFFLYKQKSSVIISYTSIYSKIFNSFLNDSRMCST